MRKLLQFSLGLILCLPCFAQDYIAVTAPSSCLKDGSGASIASARLTVQAVDTNGRPIPFRIGTGTASALISQVGRDITAGALATSLQLGNPATTAPVNIRYHFSFRDNTTNQTTNWPLVSLVANDSGNFNLCKFDPSNGGVLGPLAPGAYGNVLLNPGADQTITTGSLFLPNTKFFGWSDASFQRFATNVIQTTGSSGQLISNQLSATDFISHDVVIAPTFLRLGNTGILGFNSTSAGSGSVFDVALSRGGANQINCGNGTAFDASCAFFAGLVSSYSSTANGALTSSGVKAASDKIIGFSSTTDATSGGDAAFSRAGNNAMNAGNGTVGDKSAGLNFGYQTLNNGSTITTTPSFTAASNTGWKSILYSNQYAYGVGNSTFAILVPNTDANWLSLFGGSTNTYPANDGSTSTPDSHAKVSFGTDGSIRGKTETLTLGSSTGGQENGQTLKPILAADSTHNYPGPMSLWLSNYWDGSITTVDTWQLFPTLASGTNPASVLNLWHLGGNSRNSYFDISNQDTHAGLVTTTSIRQPLTTPASSSAACVQNAIEWDASFIYICTATNTWKRVALSTF